VQRLSGREWNQELEHLNITTPGLGDNLDRQCLNGAQNAFKPELIVLDLNLSVMSGHDFLKQCCKGQGGPPCVVFSGSHNEKDQKLALDLGASEHVRKPAELRAYISTVQNR